MANPTTNYSFAMPTNTDLVKDLPADFEVFGQAVDTQMKTNADAAIAKTIVDAKGDLIAATAADTVTRLAVGTNGQVLLADSTASTGLKWGTPAAGSLTLLSTTTLSGASTTISSISQSYRHLQVIVYGVTNGNNATFGANPNGTNNIVDYAYNYYSSGDGGGSQGQRNTYIHLSAYASLGATYSNNNFNFFIYNYSQTDQNKVIAGQNNYIDVGNNNLSENWGGRIRTTSAISSLTFESSSGTYSAGTVLIYGVN